MQPRSTSYDALRWMGNRGNADCRPSHIVDRVCRRSSRNEPDWRRLTISRSLFALASYRDPARILAGVRGLAKALIPVHKALRKLHVSRESVGSRERGFRQLGQLAKSKIGRNVVRSADPAPVS